ncbi:MAG: outer membrane beta-barrel protein [Proteobacteria bacterium]|nr:outer membrane beta-barrel protein [Pseudomonadota bacterium]
MNKKILFVLPAILLATAAPAFAGRYDNYVSLRLGYVNGRAGDVSGLNGIGATFAFGQNYRSQSWLVFRSEMELGYFAQKHDDVKLQPMSALINFYADFGARTWPLRPYVGAGFGGAYIGSNVSDNSSAGIAWNAQLGVTLGLSDDVSIDGAVRYDAVSALDYTLTNFSVRAGARWNF